MNYYVLFKLNHDKDCDISKFRIYIIYIIYIYIIYILYIYHPLSVLSWPGGDIVEMLSCQNGFPGVC